MPDHRCFSWEEIFGRLPGLTEEMVGQIKNCHHCLETYEKARNCYIDDLAATGAFGKTFLPPDLEQVIKERQ